MCCTYLLCGCVCAQCVWQACLASCLFPMTRGYQWQGACRVKQSFVYWCECHGMQGRHDIMTHASSSHTAAAVSIKLCPYCLSHTGCTENRRVVKLASAPPRSSHLLSVFTLLHVPFAFNGMLPYHYLGKAIGLGMQSTAPRSLTAATYNSSY